MIENKDRLFITQPYMRKYFDGGDDKLVSACNDMLLSIAPAEDFKIALPEGKSYAQFGSDINTLRFIQMLIRMNNVKTILELGTFIGVSALYMAKAIDSYREGIVITVESGEEFYRLAMDNFRENNLPTYIQPLLEDAKERISKNFKYDLIFMDAAKEHYNDMLHPALDALNLNGILLVDDIFFQGDTLNPIANTDKGHGVQALLESVKLLPVHYERLILPIGDGLLMIRKTA